MLIKRKMTIIGSDGVVKEKESFLTVCVMTGCRSRSLSSRMI